MRAVFPFKRPERNRWYLAFPILLLILGTLCLLDPSLRPETPEYIILAATTGYWIWEQWRFRKLPPLSLEIDEHEIRFLPRSHWGIDPIPRASIYGIREERTSLFVLYRRDGVEKVAELRRCFFDWAAWHRLPLLLDPASHSDEHP